MSKENPTTDEQAECRGSSGIYGDMEEALFCGEVRDVHGITIRHSRMTTNGELRFRMVASDQSAYIRTVTDQHSDGWQNPHYHKALKETYIVEEGWIGYAEVRQGMIGMHKYRDGDKFTTEPGIAHNIYMPPNSVIHTIKHNADKAQTEQADWHSDSSGCVLLDQMKKNTEGENWSFDSFPGNEAQEMTSEVKQPTQGTAAFNPYEQLYNEAYRHFDNLIWQVPAWSSAIFAAIIAIIGYVLNQEVETSFMGGAVPNELLASGLLVFFSVFTLVLSYALYRFRWHQSNVKPWGNKKVISPQFYLQLLVTLEAALLLMGAAMISSYMIAGTVALCLFISLIVTVYWESMLLDGEKGPKAQVFS